MEHQSIIYLIYSEIGSIGQWKIGYTQRTALHRVNEMKTSNPNIIGVFSEYKVYSEFGLKIETILKRMLKSFKIEGEWLRFEALTTDKFLKMCGLIEINLKSLKQTNTYI